RFYHEAGLLLPTSIDDQTGYRYYDPSLVELAHTITFLKDLEFSLAEIKELLKAGDTGDLATALQCKRAAIDERIARLKKARRSLDDFLTAQQEGKRLMTQPEFQCEEKTL